MASSAGAGPDGRADMPYLSIQLPSGLERVVALTGEDVTVGKSEKNSVVVDDPAVSSTHALFRFTGREWMVVDLASRNGVFVNHHRIAGSCILRYGDAVQVGHCRIMLKSKHVGGAKPAKGDKPSSKGKKPSVHTRATWIKVSGALIAKIVGPIVTLLLGLLVSGHFLASCGPHDDGGRSPAGEQRIARLHDSATLAEHLGAQSRPARRHARRPR